MTDGTLNAFLRGSLLICFALLSIGVAEGAEADQLDDRAIAIAPPPASEALARIPDFGRRLLALRSYVRAGEGLAARWSWTEDEIRAFQGSEEQRALLAEVAAVSAHFAQSNPGYEIYANTRVRSLDEQIRNWNTNASVGAAAQEIRDSWREQFGSDAQGVGIPSEKSMRAWLSSFRGANHASLAAPGLTLHGQARAIDFQIMQNGKLVAPADTRLIDTVWRAEQWDQKLKASMSAAGPSFHGPLASPDEPWHYDYAPASGAAGKAR